MTIRINQQEVDPASSQKEDRDVCVEKCFLALEGKVPLSSLTDQELSLVAPEPFLRLLVQVNYCLTSALEGLQAQPIQPHLST